MYYSRETNETASGVLAILAFCLPSIQFEILDLVTESPIDHVVVGFYILMIIMHLSKSARLRAQSRAILISKLLNERRQQLREQGLP